MVVSFLASRVHREDRSWNCGSDACVLSICTLYAYACSLMAYSKRVKMINDVQSK
jgi:hypothetical protein